MMQPIFKDTLPKTIPQRIIALAFIIILGFNILASQKKATAIIKIKKAVGIQFSGFKFSGLEKAFKDVAFVGYITDKNIENTQVAMQYAQAQFTLAPTILEFNNPQHQFLIIDCSSAQAAINKMKEVGAVPIKKNQYGIILARRPKIKF